MAKVTGEFQITLPKALVDQYGIRVGDELEHAETPWTRPGRDTNA